MKKLLNTLQTFRIGLQMEAEPKPRAKVHYLQERLARLQRLANIARSDDNIFKARQADRLIESMNNRLNANGQLLMAHIEQKQQTIYKLPKID